MPLSKAGESVEVRPGIELANLTDVGCQRENNEDYYGYFEPESDEQFRRKGRLAIVADGMGGHQGGEVASRLAVDTVRQVYSDASEGDPQTALLLGFEAAHELIRQRARDLPKLEGMGTTCTAIVLIDGKLHFAHIGDSRLYLARNSTISRLTRDHSYVNQLVDQGVISAEEALEHPQRHILTTALGVQGEISADFSETPLPLEPGDILVLCTDGLSGAISDEELLAIITSNAPSEACKELVERAKMRGGSDNITVQVLRVNADSEDWNPGKV